MRTTESRLKRAAGVIEELWPNLLTALAALILSIASISISSPSLTLKDAISSRAGQAIAVGVLISLLGSVVSGSRTMRAAELARKNETLNAAYNEALESLESAFHETIRYHLAKLAEELDLSDRERISMYIHDGVSAFTMVGRYSKNPEFHKVARPKYPDDEGCIAAAWTHGFCYVSNLPDPDADFKIYQDVLLKQHFVPKKTSRAFRMKSRCLAAAACEGSSPHRIGVIVVESTLPTGIARERAGIGLKSHHVTSLAKTIEIMNSFAPNSAYAKGEGY